MSEQPKKRPWFQFHLSTAVALMFVAAGLLWLNMNSQVAFMHWDGTAASGTVYVAGFPMPAITINYASRRAGPADAKSRIAETTIGCHSALGLVVDASFVLSILAVIAFVLECFAYRPIRRTIEPPEDGPS